MAIPYIQRSEELERPSYTPHGGAGTSGIDPNLLRLLAERRRKQGLAGATTTPGQRQPQPQVAPPRQMAPIDPRLRAAMMMRQRLRQQYQQQQAPTYGGVQPRKL